MQRVLAVPSITVSCPSVSCRRLVKTPSKLPQVARRAEEAVQPNGFVVAGLDWSTTGGSGNAHIVRDAKWLAASRSTRGVEMTAGGNSVPGMQW